MLYLTPSRADCPSTLTVCTGSRAAHMYAHLQPHWSLPATVCCGLSPGVCALSQPGWHQSCHITLSFYRRRTRRSRAARTRPWASASRTACPATTPSRCRLSDDCTTVCVESGTVSFDPAPGIAESHLFRDTERGCVCAAAFGATHMNCCGLIMACHRHSLLSVSLTIS